MSMYTDFITVDLAADLCSKGMKVDIVDDSVEEYPNRNDCHCETTFADVFDFLAEKGIHVAVIPSWSKTFFRFSKDVFEWRLFKEQYSYGETEGVSDWHEAATSAIKKAITLL